MPSLCSLLADVDAEIDAACPRESLCPSRSRATSFTALAELLLSNRDRSTIADPFCEGLAAIGRATLRHFPENIYWDYDYLAASLTARPTADELAKTARLVVELLSGFGVGTKINFCYVHDFTFGYDWARWVAKDAEARSHVTPFSLEFLGQLDRRRHELEGLIARDDAKYGRLPPGTVRNPFFFAREPCHERLLLTTMVADDLVPVKTWQLDGQRFWNRDYTELREQVATRLGIPMRRSGGCEHRPTRAVK